MLLLQASFDGHVVLNRVPFYGFKEPQCGFKFLSRGARVPVVVAADKDYGGAVIAPMLLRQHVVGVAWRVLGEEQGLVFTGCVALPLQVVGGWCDK